MTCHAVTSVTVFIFHNLRFLINILCYLMEYDFAHTLGCKNVEININLIKNKPSLGLEDITSQHLFRILPTNLKSFLFVTKEK